MVGNELNHGYVAEGGNGFDFTTPVRAVFQVDLEALSRSLHPEDMLVGRLSSASGYCRLHASRLIRRRFALGGCRPADLHAKDGNFVWNGTYGLPRAEQGLRDYAAGSVTSSRRTSTAELRGTTCPPRASSCVFVNAAPYSRISDE